MTLDPEIKRKLDALTAKREFTPDGAMILAPSGGDVAFAAVLNAIDVTVLPRKLTFMVDKMSVTVSVAGRRLRSVDAMTGVVPDLSRLFGHMLTASDDDALAALGDALKALTSQPGTLVQRSATADAGVAGAAEGGVSVARLAAIWSVDLDAKPPSPLEQFCLAMGQSLRAMLVIKKDDMQTGLGDETLQTQLRGFWLGELPGFDRNLTAFPSAAGKNTVVFQQADLAEADAICFLRIADMSVLAGLSGVSAAQVASCWQQIKP